MTIDKVFCYVHGADDRWQAICPAFDIAVQGESFEEVRRVLAASISTYISDASAENPETARRLLSRKAPLAVRVGLAWRFLRHIVTGGDRDREFTAGFDLPCHA